jgi:hypothetical protein
MIGKSRKTTERAKGEVMNNFTRDEFSKNELPEPYRRLLGLIFHSPDHLIHKAKIHDKISS